ncbi:MAG: TetR/AcrR family transcriptional regulator [Dehalococcoidia bacterium]|jgi:TetR/AcrR family fatty acid metabolism transcriptional regulator
MAKPADPNRREDILKAAREVFKRSGYEKAHVEDIAQLAGVAKGTVYLYFKSKQAMLDALCDYYQEMISDALVSSMQNPDTHTAIKEAVHAGLAVASRERDLLKLLDLRLGLKAGGDAIENPRGQKILRRFFRERVANGDMQDFDPVIASELTGGFVQWISKLCLLWRNVDVSRYEDTAVSMLQSALLSKKNARGG